MLTFLPVLARLTVRTKKRIRVKEMALGVGVGVVMVIAGVWAMDWAVWALLLYGVGIQAVALSENDVFYDHGDVRRLGFRELTWRYRLVCLTQYVARDMFIANGLALTIGLVGLSVLGRPWAGVCLVVTYVGSLALIPSYVYLAPKLSEQRRMVCVCVSLVVVLGLVVPLVTGWRVPLADAPPLAAAVVAGFVVHLVAVDAVAIRLRGASVATLGGRRWLGWLAPHAPHLFKDLVLFQGMAAQSLLGVIALMTLLAIGSPPSMMPTLIMVAVWHDNLFLGRRNKRYRLLAVDPQFCEEKLSRDRARIRRSKLLTLSVDYPVKALVTVVILAASGASWDPLACMLLVGAVLFLIAAPLPYIAEPLARFLRGLVGYLLVAGFAVGAWMGHLAPVVVGCLIAAALYAPSLVRVYVPRRPRRTADGTPLLRPGAVLAPR